MSRLILLVGNPNTGKTITLKILTSMILPFSKTIKSPRTPRTVSTLCQEIDAEMKAQKKDNKNFKTVLEVHEKKIGISTIGDSIPEIKETIKFFQNNHCDVIFAPCQTEEHRFPRLTLTA